MTQTPLSGTHVASQKRLSDKDITLIDSISRDLLEDPGVLCYNPAATAIFRKAGAHVEETEGNCSRIRIPSTLLDALLKTVPSRVVLGARNPAHALTLDAEETRVHFATGAETNIWLDVAYDGDTPTYTRQAGSCAHLAQSAHLCYHLDRCDAFIRNVNIQDKEITEENKDINKYITALNNTAKHVMASVDSLDALDDLMALGHLIAGGEKEFENNPVLSFITCVVKSPLQIVEDTAYKTIAIAKKKAPLVISSSPMAGTTAPFDEWGMVAQINAEILTGIALTQCVAPGAPVLYGAVPVRTRLDTLYDMYGAPEFVHYNADCAQMARYYGIPCYSSAGVGDAAQPGIQATAEKMLTHACVPGYGAQYIHYAFGLLERTNVFCPEQAVLDNAHLDAIMRALAPAQATDTTREDTCALIREVMQSSHKTYVYHLPLPTRDPVYMCYPLEHDSQDALRAAHERVHDIYARETPALPKDMREHIRTHFSGVLPQALTPFNT